MKRFIPTLLSCLTGIACLAQEKLVDLKDLTFSSEFEKKVLENHFSSQSSGLFSLFIASGDLLNENALAGAEKQFYDHIKQLGDLSSKKNEKKIKLIYEDIHDRFLKKYELKNQFEDIFYNGYYNCVSASALYGLTFQQLNIPFVVKEKPTHVYLIAYPDSERIVVETTTPVGGFILMNPQFKQQFVKNLKDQKLISAQEYANTNVNDLFDRFYFGAQENITLVQLAGLQYSNDGINLLEEGKSLEAMHQFEKAYLFYPSERHRYLLMTATHDAFSKQEAKDSTHAKCLAKLSRYKAYGIKSEMIQGEYARVIQELLFEKGQKEKLLDYHNVLLRLVKDEDLRSELAFIYQYENARLLYNQARYKDGIPFLEECLTLKPNHQDASNLFIGCIAQSQKGNANRETLASLEAFAGKHPRLLENNIFNEMMGSTYLIEARQSYDDDKPAEGEKYKAAFERFRQLHTDVAYNPYLIGQAYSAAAVYYFRKGQTSKARTIISKGLEFAPNNYELLTRRRMIE